jgi:hypothetical protein
VVSAMVIVVVVVRRQVKTVWGKANGTGRVQAVSKLGSADPLGRPFPGPALKSASANARGKNSAVFSP